MKDKMAAGDDGGGDDDDNTRGDVVKLLGEEILSD